ncbi:MAG: hypothetical protein M3P23_02350 [Actinomycetota bacterium]|nr:hypothetical protein [Actinomycetota bacterium]
MKPQTLSRLVAGSVAVAAIGAAVPAPAALAAGPSVHAAVATLAGGFVPLTPFRVLDTRHAIGAPTHKVASNATLSFTAAGGAAAPVPPSVSAVVLNVTVTGTLSSGFITAFPSTTVRPTVSNLNFAKGQTVANLVTVPVGPDGKVSLYNGSAGSVDLLADVAGYYVVGTATDPGMFAALAPKRILDTRNGTGAAKHVVGAAATLPLTVGGAVGSGVPANAKAVVLNVTATTPTKTGFVTVFPTGSPKPTVSNLNYTAGRTVPNLVTVALGTSGQVSLYNGSSGTVNLIADVAGYYLTGTATDVGAFVPVTPKRILDTRSHLGTPSNSPIDPTFDVGLQTVNTAGVPIDGVAAVAMNVTATAPTKTGYVTVSPTDPTRPSVSNLNHAAGQTIANMAIVPPGLCSKATFYNGSSGTTHLLADVAGYFIGDTSGGGNPSLQVKALGGNSLGDLGDGTTTDSQTPVKVLNLHDVSQVGAGLAVTNDNSVWAWGPDELAQLYAGTGVSTDQGLQNCSIPQRIAGLTGIVKVAGTPANGFALDATGQVYSWGFNDVNQLGRNGVTDDFQPGNIPQLNNKTIIDIAQGQALSSTGAVYSWGDNTDGELGVDPATTPNTVALGHPMANPNLTTGVSALGQGVANLALMSDTTVKAWGSNFSSALGNGTAPDNNPHWVPSQVSNVADTGDLTGVVKIDGDMALLSDGSVVTWGLNDAGQLGDGSALGTTTTHPVAVGGIPAVDTTLGSQTIATSETNDAVLGADGTVWAWGAGLANGGTSDSSTPAQITGLTTTDDDLVGVGAGFESTFAILP